MLKFFLKQQFIDVPAIGYCLSKSH